MTNKDQAKAQASAIGLLIRQARIERGVSQEELSKSLGVTFQQVQKYEKGTNRISLNRFIPLCKALNKSPEFFMQVDAEIADYNRLDLELVRNFSKIKEESTRVAINRLVLDISKGADNDS